MAVVVVVFAAIVPAAPFLRLFLRLSTSPERSLGLVRLASEIY